MLAQLTISDHSTAPVAYPAYGEQELQQPVEPQTTKKQCVIIIDDNPGDVFIMEEALREHNLNCDPTVLVDGEQAATFFDRVDNDAAAPCPDVVLLDLNLPKRSGHWVLSRIRASSRCPRVPVVVVSSSEAPADIERNEQLGATAYFKKPSSLEKFMLLGALVRSLLRGV